jgi:peptidoglycan/LPS O-acetylase OafA/YrhL
MIKGSVFRSDIEGLRGIAVLSVVVFHCGVVGVSGGFVGVDVFFVLSGYLITGLLANEIRTTSHLNLLQFYARRARRLLPAAALVSIATLVAGVIIMAPNELTLAARAARATAVYMSNMFFALNAADYFASDVKWNPMLHTWTLAVEEQFYLFWPVLIMLGLRHRRSQKLLVWLLSIGTVISLAASIRLTNTAPAFAFYGLPTRAWEFGIGGLAILIPQGSLKGSSAALTALGWLGLLSMLASFHFISARQGFPGWIAVIPVLGATLTLIAGAEVPHVGVGRVLDSKPLQFLGTMSYSWYLWHWPFLVFAAVLYPSISTAGRIVAALAALVVATVAHYLIENPLRFQPRLVRNPILSLGFGGVLMALSLSAAFISLRFAARLAIAPAMQPITAAVNDIADMERERCVIPAQVTEVKTCSFGAAASPTTIVLFGDSHAMQWFNPMRLMAERHGWQLLTVLKSGCPATDVAVSDDCTTWRADAITRIQSLRPTLVVVANATQYLARKDAPIPLDEWKRGTRRTLSALTANDSKVVAIRDTPLPGFDVPTCLARSVRHAWYSAASCQIARSSAITPSVFEAEESAVQGLPGVRFIDLTDQICNGDACPAIRDGVIVYRDDNHLTGAFAQSLLPALEARLTPLLGLRGAAAAP